MNWQASQIEHRTAWIISICCLLFVFILSVKPDLFEPSPETELKQIETAAVKVSPPAEVAEEDFMEPEAEQRPVVKAIRPAPVAKAAPAVIKPKVIKKEVPKPVTKPAAPVAHQGYYVQLGAFKEKPRALNIVKKVKAQGWNAIIQSKSNGFYLVWAGPKYERDAIISLQNTIEKRLKMKGFIVQKKS